ncbi:MAG: hypothetical protein M3515_10330 [Actinomycetota bacterium]|nr:hypothetical protein [Actinomycetota bacterium]
MARKLLQGARAATGAARHLAWYLSYCVDGSATRPVHRATKWGPSNL